jgi:hypothetical protein
MIATSAFPDGKKNRRCGKQQNVTFIYGQTLSPQGSLSEYLGALAFLSNFGQYFICGINHVPV